jgi:hypothetical protein
MAIKKSDLEQVATQLLSAKIDAIELGIDAELRGAYYGSIVYIIPSNLRGWDSLSFGQRQLVIRELKRRYGSAGWIVEYDSNQHDGETFSFK